MGEMPANSIQLLGAGLVATVGLAATSGAASAPATGSRLAADAAQGKSKIAFITRGPNRTPGLYVMNTDGSGQRRLTGNVLVRTPAWSPDGRRIAFESFHACRTPGARARCAYTSGIYVANADGSFRLRVARIGGSPAWSPDGRTIAFSSGGKIYLMNADGSEHRPLTKPGTAGRLRSLAWSPDGRKLAFLYAPSCQFCFNLYVVNSDGSGLRNLTAELATGSGPGIPFTGAVVTAPAWSPDGRKLAFVRLNAGRDRSPVYVVRADSSGLRNLTPNVVRADGSGLRNLTPKPVAYAHLAWSPNGRKLAFVSDRDGNSEVYVMNADGSGQRNLTRHPAFDAEPAWSPDGRSIAFRSTRDGNPEIYVMNADGSGQRNLTRSPASEGWFAWSPGQRR
jgi:Tol biopolymer transport system component